MPRSARWLLLVTLGATALLCLPVLGRSFGDLDDWTHLETSLGLLRGDGVAWHHVLIGRTGVASARPGSALAWAVDFALFGYRPWGYFATNLLLHLGLVAGVFTLCWRLGRSAWAAALAAILVGLSASTSQSVYYLSGRDDGMANAVFVAAVLLWHVRRDRWGGRLGVAALYLLGAACKPTILPLPVLLLLDDVLRDGRAALAPRRLLARYGPLLVAALAVVLLLFGVLGTANPGSLLTPEQRDGLAAGRGLGRFAGRVAAALLLPLFSKEGGVGAIVFDAPRLALLLLALGTSLRRGVDRRLLLFGLGWLVVNLAMPLPFVVMESWRAQDAGRYLQLPGVGFALVAASLVVRPASGRWWRWLVPVWMVAVALPFAARVTPTLGVVGVDTAGFVRAIGDAAADLPQGGRVVVALRGPDQGLTSLAASSVLLEQVPALRGKPYVFLEGGERLYRNTQRGPTYDYARFTALQDDFALRELDTGERDRLVASQPGGGWARVVLDPALFEVRSPVEPPSWSFREGDDGGWTWRGVPAVLVGGAPRRDVLAVARPPLRLGAGLQLYQDGYLPPAVLDRALRFVQAPTSHLLSPPLDLLAPSICRVTLSVVLPDRVEPSYAESDFLVPSRRFALLGWSEEDAPPARPFERYVVLPLSEWAGPQSVTVALDNSPGWLSAGRVRRLTLLPSNVPGPVDVGALVLEPCR